MAARQRRQVRLKYVLIAAAAFAVVVTFVVVQRLRQVEEARREALEGVVTAEALALRISDKNAFMFRQGPAEDWRQRQRETFTRFAQAQETIVVTDEVLNVEMSGDQARVAVRVMVNGQPDQAVWLYEYTDKGWRHVGTEAEPWSPLSRATAWFTFEYYAVNQPMVDEMGLLLTGWWETAMRMTGRSAPLRLAITLDEAANEIEWADNEQTELTIPALDAAGAPLTALPRDMRSRLAEMMAIRWVDHARLPNERGQDAWFSWEARQMLWHAFDPATDASAPVLEYLAAAFSPELIPTTFSLIGENQPVPEAIQQAMRETSPGALEGEALLAYLTNYLRAEAAFDQDRRVEAINPQSYAGRVFLDRERAHSDGIYLQTIGLSAAPVDSVRVLDVRQSGEILWAFTEYDMIWWWLDSDRSQTVTTFIPFRFANGYWTHTAALASDWGGQITENGSRVHLRYHDLDAPYTDDLRGDLEDLYVQLAADFSLDDPGPITVDISPAPSTQPNPGGQAIRPEAYSLHAICCSTGDTPADSLRMLAGSSLATELYNYRFLERGPMPSSVIATALVAWELDRLGWQYSYDWLFEADAVPGVSLPATLNELWGTEMNWEDEQAHYAMSARMQGVRVLLDLLVERYGADVVPALVDHMLTAGSTEDWLDQSIGVEAADVEAEWQRRFTALMAQRQAASTH